jgi:uncharacterized protein (UPF0335 family)
MAKKKKKRPVKYPHLISKDYLEAVSHKLWEINPSKKIVYNTLVGVWKEGYNRGYNRKCDEVLRFRKQKELHFTEDLNIFITYLEDLSYDKSDNKPTFDQWFKIQEELKRKAKKHNENGK